MLELAKIAEQLEAAKEGQFGKDISEQSVKAIQEGKIPDPQEGQFDSGMSEESRRAIQEGKIPDPSEGRMLDDKHQQEINRALLPEDYQKELDVALSDKSEDWAKKLLPDEGDSVQEVKDAPSVHDVSERMTEELKKIGNDYNDEVRDKSAAGEVNPNDVSKWKEVSVEECHNERADFQHNKDAIRSDWEKKNGQEWPRYKEDVYSEKGKLLAKEGDKYDAHHIQPLKYGGENTVENITPIHKNDHGKVNGIHRADSPYAKLEDHFKAS